MLDNRMKMLKYICIGLLVPVILYDYITVINCDLTTSLQGDHCVTPKQSCACMHK